MTKPLPDFTSPEWQDRSPRAKLYAIREFVLNHEGPIAQADVRRMMAATYRLSISLISQSHSCSKYDLDKFESSRMLCVEIALFDPEPA